MSERMSEDMSEDMSERMSERMSEDASERMYVSQNIRRCVLRFTGQVLVDHASQDKKTCYRKCSKSNVMSFDVCFDKFRAERPSVSESKVKRITTAILWHDCNKQIKHAGEEGLQATPWAETERWQAMIFFWSMLRSSLQLWQSQGCAKVVMGRQLDRKDWSATWESKRKTKPTTPTNKPAPKNPQVLTNRWKGETGETGSRSHYLVAQNSKKTPALTTSSASCRKCQGYFNGLYTLRPANPAIHHGCLPRIAMKMRSHTCQSGGAHKHHLYMSEVELSRHSSFQWIDVRQNNATLFK